MSKTLERLLEAQLQSPESFRLTLRAEQTNLTAELAEEARRTAQDARQAGDIRKTFAAYTIAAYIFDAIGEPEKAFENRLNVLQIPFAVAQSEDQYKRVYDETQHLLNEDASVPPDLRFRALAFAADCAYWAADAADTTDMKREWLGRTFDILEKAAPSIAKTGEESSVLRCASILVVSFQTLREIAPDMQTLLDAQTRFAETATTLDARGLVYPDAEKTAHVASYLAEIAAKTWAPSQPLYGRK